MITTKLCLIDDEIGFFRRMTIHAHEPLVALSHFYFITFDAPVSSSSCI